MRNCLFLFVEMNFGLLLVVLRYTTKHFNEEKEHIKKTLYKTINQYGGVLSVSEPDVVYYPKANVKGQFNLFQNGDEVE